MATQLETEMAKRLHSVKPENPKPKRKRESFDRIEVRPTDDWFVSIKTVGGRTIWYLRLEITGRNPRLYGPFPSKQEGLLCLDEILPLMLDEYSAEMNDACKKRMIKEFQHMDVPVVEHPLLRQLYEAAETRSKATKPKLTENVGV